MLYCLTCEPMPLAVQEREQRIRIAVFDLNPNTGAFREHTHTLAVGPASATIRLRHPVVPGTTLTIYNLENGKQADFVMESAPAPQQVRVRPADQAVDIWEPTQATPASEEAPAPEEPRVTREDLEQGRPPIAETQQGIETGEVRVAADEGTAREAAARVVEGEETVARAVDYAHLLDVHIDVQARTLEVTQREAMGVSLRTVQSLRRELEELVDRAAMSRGRAEKLTREATDACARAAASASDLQALRADKKAADQKLAEVRHHLKEAESAFAAVRAEVARTAPMVAPSRSRVPAPPPTTEGPPEAKAAPEPVVTPEPVAAPEPVVTPEPAAAPEPVVTPEPVAAPEPVVTAEPAVAPEPVAASEPMATAEPVAATRANREASLTTTRQFVAGFSGPVSWDDRRTTRRIQVRTRARIRRPDLVEVVQPINLSRRGLCFESRYPYELNSAVWVVLHYQEDTADLIETPSRIVRIIPRGNGESPYYGVRFEA